MIVVANTSPVCYLELIGHLDLLLVLFGQIIIPEAVREELASEVDPPYRVRESVGGRHIAVTLEPRVETAKQVLDVYRRLGSMVGLVMLW